MARQYWLTLTDAARLSQVPYQSIHKWALRGWRRGDVRLLASKNGLMVHNLDLEQYLVRRGQQQRNGTLTLKQTQAKTALRALEIIRSEKKANDQE